jgi:hypothetical protein
MATLTASGINCSNGTLDGLYTGTTLNNSAYPIGSMLSVRVTVSLPQPNVATNVYSPGNGNYDFFQTSNGTGAVLLSGTWRSRGRSGTLGGGCVEVFLAQRVA